MRVRENGESIALLGGEEEERSGIDRSFGKVLKQWALLCGQHMRTTIVSQGSSLIAPVIPILLCSPKFLEGSMTLGQVMQAASAFTIRQLHHRSQPFCGFQTQTASVLRPRAGAVTFGCSGRGIKAALRNFELPF